MVVFTCGYCGESVQKHRVEKHYMSTKCRNTSPNLSCMDCFKDFSDNSYEEHTKCVTEGKRHSGKGFVAKEKKGEKKQNPWINLVQSVLDEQKNIPRNVLKIIETISKHNNIPSKKPKFFNFVKNVCGAKTGAKEIEQAWELVSPKFDAVSNTNQRNKNKKNGSDKADETQENGGNDGDKQQVSQDVASQDSEIIEKGDADHNNDAPVEVKKLSKKQRKEIMKRQKYEAELQSAEAPPEEVKEDEEGKKGKKKKNRTESLNDETETFEGKKNKLKKQDTVNSVPSAQEVTKNENGVEVVQNGTAKTQKKKPKVDVDEEGEENLCLHDQNVAKISELCLHDQNIAKIGEKAMNDKFNWHAVIVALLQKKGNELPFKRLQKKVLAEYSETTGRNVDDRIANKFIKKLKSAPRVRVDKNRVSLLD